MISQKNYIEIVGYVGSFRHCQVGDMHHLSFTVATSCVAKTNNGIPIVETCWHTCTLVAKAGADKENHLPAGFDKGVPVRVIGRIRQIPYTTSDQETRYSSEIFVRSVEVISDSLKTEDSWQTNSEK